VDPGEEQPDGRCFSFYGFKPKNNPSVFLLIIGSGYD